MYDQLKPRSKNVGRIHLMKVVISVMGNIFVVQAGRSGFTPWTDFHSVLK